eukprot:6486719-Amphidinium_carterae.1
MPWGLHAQHAVAAIGAWGEQTANEQHSAGRAHCCLFPKQSCVRAAKWLLAKLRVADAECAAGWQDPARLPPQVEPNPARAALPRALSRQRAHPATLAEGCVHAWYAW